MMSFPRPPGQLIWVVTHWLCLQQVVQGGNSNGGVFRVGGKGSFSASLVAGTGEGGDVSLPLPRALRVARRYIRTVSAPRASQLNFEIKFSFHHQG